MATELVGGASIDTCLPASWKNASPSEEGDMDTNVATEQTTWQKIGSYIGIAINVVCIAKDIVESIIDFFSKNAKRFMRRYIRLFLQGKIRRAFSMRGWFSSAWDSIKSAASTAASAVAKGAAVAYNTVKNATVAAATYVGKAVTAITDQMKTVITGIIDSAVSAFETMRAKVTKFFSSPLMQAILTFVKCLKALKEAAGNVAKLITGFTEKAALVASFPLGWIKIIIGLICAWEDLKGAIDYLIKGWNEKTATIKWNYYGKFVGKLVYTIGTS
jgi:phage-related protein